MCTVPRPSVMGEMLGCSLEKNGLQGGSDIGVQAGKVRGRGSPGSGVSRPGETGSGAAAGR